MSEHSVEGVMGTMMEKIKEMVDVNTVIGDPIETPDGTTIIPVSKVTYGFASGGADFPSKRAETKDPFGGGGGAGITVVPIAFIAVSNGNVKLLQVQPFDNTTDRIIGMVPQVIDKISDMIKSNKEKKNNKKKEEKSNVSDIEIEEIEI